jgi:hypothetical protein
MIDDVKLATLNVSNDLPIDDGISKSIAPNITMPENPFANISSIVPSSKPQYKNVGISADDAQNILLSGRQKLLQDPFIQAQRTEVPEVAGYNTIKQSENFDTIGVFPGLDVEETYGTAETNWEKISKGVVGAGILATHQFADQLLSWGDTAGMFAGNTPFKEAEFDAINQWQNDFDNKYHIFQTQEDRNTFFNMSNFASTLQTSGYGIGAILEIAAEEIALSALTAATFGATSEIQAARTIQLGFKLGKVIKNTRNLEKSLQGTNTLRKIFNSSFAKFINPLDNITDFATTASVAARADRRVYGATTGALRTTARGFGAFYRDLRMLNAGITEAKATVAPTMNQAYEMAVEEYKKINNAEPSEDIKKNLKQKALEAVQIEGAVQAAWIALSDKVSFGGVLNKFKGLRFLDDGLVAKGIFTNTKSAIKEGGDLFVAKKGIPAFIHQLKVSPVKTLIKAPIVYAKSNIMEGVQESGQDIIDSATKQWYMYNYGSEEQRKEQKSMNDFLYAGAKEQLTMDGLKTFMSGFLTGGIINVLGGGINVGKSLYERTVNTDGYKSSVERADAERNKLVGTLNSSTNNKTDFYRSLVELNSAMNESAKNGRKKEYWDNKNDFINKYVLSIVKSGVEDVVIDRMRESVNDLTVDEFKQAYKGSVHEGLSEEKSKDIMRDLLNTFETKVKEVKETYEDIKNNYGNPYNPKQFKIGTPEYAAEVANFMAAEEAINQMAFSKSTYIDIAKRQQGILKNIKGYVPNLNFSTLYSLTSPSITLKKELDILQKEYESTSDETLKTEKKQKIDLLTKYKENVEKTSKEIEEISSSFDKTLSETENKKIIFDKINEIKTEFSKENAEAINEILKLENKDSESAITTDAVNKAVGDIFDYLQLQSDFEDSLSYFNTIANPNAFQSLHKAHLAEQLEMMGDISLYQQAGKDYLEKNPNNTKHFVLYIKKKHVLYSPKGEYISKHDTKEDAEAIAEQYDEMYDENANRITITVTDLNGEERNVEIIENNFYLTEENQNVKETKAEGLTEDEKYNLEQLENELTERTDGLVKNGMPKKDAAKQAYNEIFKDEKNELNKDGELYEKLKEKSNKKVTSKEKKSKFKRDVIKIISIEEDVISYQINYQPEIQKKSAEEFGKEFGYLTNFKTISAYERFFYTNRNKNFKIKVNKKYSKPHKLDDNDYSNVSYTVDAVLVGEYNDKGEFKLSMQYKNPNPKSKLKTVKVPFNIKYYEKYALKRQPAGYGLFVDSINKDLLYEEAENQKAQDLEDQQSALSLLIQRVENNLQETEAKREANNKRLEDLRAELELLQEDLATAEEYLKNNPYKGKGNKTTAYKTMMEKLKSFPEIIQSVEATILDLTEELNALNEIYDASVQARDNYYSALDEIEKTKERFQQDVNGNIYTEEESNLNESRSKLITQRYNKEQVDNFILNTEIEIEELKDIILNFENIANKYKEIWARLSQNLDVIDILNNDDNKQRLAIYLKNIERSSGEDEKTVKFIKALRKSIVNNTTYIDTVKEISLAFKNAKEAFDKIETELFPKLQRLQQASEQLTEFNKLKDRVDFLKYIQNELFEEVNYIQERRRIIIESMSAKKAESIKLNPNANIVEVVNGDDLFVSEDGFNKPLISQTALYLTTGKHFDDEDKNVNLESGNARFFKFAENVNVEVGNYFLMAVTKENDTYGITFDENDIKVIVVEKSGEEYFPVDITGYRLENPTSDNIVYTSLRMNQEMLFGNIEDAKKWVESRFTTKGVTNEQLINMIYKYRDFVKNIRSTVSSNAEVIIPIKGKTVGTQVMLPKDVNGLPQELTLQGRLIEEKTTDYSNLRHPNGQTIDLKVATDTSDGIKPGRLYMKREDGQIFRVFNRQLNESEKNNFINLLKQLSKLYQKEKVEALTNEEQANKNSILTYFQGLVFWTTDDNVIESDNKFYINEKGILYRGRNAYDLNESIIEENKEDIVSELRHQVNNSLLTKTNTPFYAVSLDNENKIILDEYSNYTEYLFKNSEPVIYTNVPRYDETDITTPQVKSVNLIYTNVNDDFVPIVNFKNQTAITIPGIGNTKITLVPGAANTFTFTNSGEPIDNIAEPATPAKKTIPPMVFATASTAPVAQPSIGNKLEAIQEQNITVAPFTPEKIKEHSSEELAEAKKAFGNGFNINSINLVNRKPDENYRLQLDKTVAQTEDFDKVVEWFASRLPNIKVEKVYELIDGKAWGAFKNGVVYIYENAEIGTGFHEAFEAVWNGYLSFQEQNELAEEFRNREGKFTNPFTNETKNYSEASAYDVREMLAEEFRSYILKETDNIQTGNETTFGKIKNFFKELWNTIKKYIGISKKNKVEGDSLVNNLFNKINKGNYSNVRFARTVEEMGISYREVIPDTTQEFTTQFIDGLSSYFFMNLHNPNLIKDSKGNFIKLNIESLLTEDQSNNKILKELFSASINDVYYSLFGENSIYYNNYYVPLFLKYQKSVARNLTEEELTELKNQAYVEFSSKNKYATMVENAFQNPTNVYNLLKKSLSKFGLQFEEKIETEEDDKINEDAPSEMDVVDTSGIKDSIFIDPRRLTSTSFRILIGSLTNDIYDVKSDSIVAKRNSLNLPELVDYDTTLNLLLNELNGTYSRLKNENDEVIFYDALKAMFTKLDNKYFDKKINQYKPGFVWINKLKSRLNYSGNNENYFKTQTINLDDLKLLVGFEKSLMNKKNTPLTLILNENGVVYSTNSLESTNEKRIREEWEGELPRNLNYINDKEENNNKLLGISSDGTIIFDKKSIQYKTFLKQTDKNIDLSTALSYLRDMGVIFTGVNYKNNGTIGETSPYILKNRHGIIDAFIKIKNSITSNDENSIKNITDLYSNIGPESNNMKKLIDIEKVLRYESSILTHLTASGQTQYSITLPASINYVLASLNESETLGDFVLSNPQFGTVGYNKNGEQVVTLFPYQKNSELLKLGGLFFDEFGNKKNNIELGYNLISGVSSMQTNGEDTGNLTYPDRIMQEINYILNADKTGLNPIYYTLINSDKSSEFGLSYSKPFINPTIADYGIENPNFNKVLDIYLNHLSDEIDAAKMEKDNKTNIQYYSENVKYLGHFKDVLGFKTDKELKELGIKKSQLQVKYEKILSAKIDIDYVDLKEEFLADPVLSILIKKDLQETVKFTIDSLIDLGIIDKIDNNVYRTVAINKETLATYFQIEDSTNMTLADVEKLVTYITINKELAITEQHKLLYGHPALYKDLAKRANGINSSKDGIVDNPHVIAKADTLIPRFDGKVRAAEKIQTFKNITFKDVTAVSNVYKEIAEGLYQSIILDEINKENAENRIGAKFNSDGTFKNFILDKKGKFTGEIKAYLELNEADGQGWVMPDMYRDILFLSSKLTDKQLQQIDYEIAYEIKARSSKSKIDPAYKEYKKGKYTLKWAESILAKGNPNAALPVIKPQYFGYAVNTAMMQTVFLKHSVQPKFYRSVEGTEYEKLYLVAQKEQIDVIGFESGEKVGALLNPKTGKFIDFHKENGELNLEFKNKSWQLPQGLAIQSLYTKFYGIQSEQPAIYKNKVVRGTQVTKLIMSNFKVNGSYVNQEIETLILEYNKTIDQITTKGKSELLNELGITAAPNNKYLIEDYSKMVNLLSEELTKRDLPSNLIDALKVDPETKGLIYKFDTLINRDKIDNILSSIVDSRVISPKMFGKPSVQVASTGYNSTNRKMMYLKNDVYTEMEPGETLTEEQKETVIPTSSDLNFYKLENGKISKMEVYVPWYFDGVSPEDLGLKLVNGVYKIPANMDKRLLTMIGFRIPTQGMNSIENIVVKGFLPKENGDMIVVPTEIVGKSGSDFDIDKMNLYMSNYKVKYTKFTNEEITEFKKTDFYKKISDKSKAMIVKLGNEKFLEVIEDLNNFSVTSNTGKYGNLKEYLDSNNITGDENKMYTELKNSLVQYNAYRKEVIKNNKDNRKQFKPIVEDIIYVESNEDNMKSLQNKLKEIMDKIISQPENYRQLIMPNSTATLKSIANEINELKQKGSSEKSMLSLRKFIQSAETRERYLTGKRLVGIAALQSTSHVISQISDIMLSGNYEVSKIEFLVKYDPTYKKENGKYRKDIEIKLSYNNKEIGKFYINAKTDAEGRWISENISEALSGFVDAAKDPFVFDLNINFNTAATWFYLQKLGVPMREIAYLFNQPAVNKFMQLESNNNSIFKTVNKNTTSREFIFINAVSEYMATIDPSNKTLIDEINLENSKGDNEKDYGKLKVLKTNLFSKINDIRLEITKPDVEKLKNLIKNLNNSKYKMTAEDAKLQVSLLSDYLEYYDQSGNLTEFINSIGYDNQKSKTIIENKLQQITWNKMVENGFIANPESVLDKTFIGEMKKQKEDLFSLFKDMFISLEPKAIPVFEKMYDFLSNRKIFISNENKALLINKYQKFFITYVIQNTTVKINNVETTIANKFNELMMSANSIANQLQKLKNSPDYNISQNLAVKELIPIFANNVNDPNNIKLFRNKMTTYKNDVLIESINNLLDYAQASGNTELENFVNNLTAFSILQSGLQDSTINFTKILPAHLYSKVVNDILNIYLTNESTIDHELVWQQFHQNNKFDNSIVKKPMFFKTDKTTGNILIDVDFSDSEYEFIRTASPKKGISNEKITGLMSNKKAMEAFDYYVNKRIGYKTQIEKGIEKTYAVYMPLIPLGDGRNYTETSEFNITKSNLKKNNIVSAEGFKVGSVYEENTPIVSLPLTMPSIVTSSGAVVTLEDFTNMGKAMFGVDLKPSEAAVAPNMKLVMQKTTDTLKSIKGYGFDSISVTKDKYTKALVQKNLNTAYVYTENNYSLTAFPNKEGKGTAIIRPESNAFAIVTKKKYDYNTKENVDYSDTDIDFEEFKNINTELINKIKESGKSKLVFPEGFGTGLAKMPTRFAEWLQKELFNNFGLVTELNKTKDGLISIGLTNQNETIQEKTLTLMDTIAYPISEINSNLLKNIGYTPVQIKTLMNSLYSQIKTNSGKSLKEINLSAEDWDNLSIEEKINIKKCN